MLEISPVEWLAWLDSPQMAVVAQKNVPNDPCTIPNCPYSVKFSVKSTTGLPDVEVLPLAVSRHKSVIAGSYSLISGKVGIPR